MICDTHDVTWRSPKRSAMLWQGTSWEAGMAEAQAVVAAASGDAAAAVERMQSATAQFEQAGQPLDADRCRRAMAGYQAA